MDRYIANGNTPGVKATGATAFALVASVAARGLVYQYTISNFDGQVGDNLIEWLIDRFSADGTGVAASANPVDPAAPANQLTAKQQYTVEPTISAHLIVFGVHQRATFHWTCTPGDELLIPATAGNGVAWRAQHATYSRTAQMTVYWKE